jgi:hypothetical protein
VLIDPSSNPNPAEPSRWILSARIGGTPGESGAGADTFAGDPFKDTDGDGLSDLYEFAAGSDPENPASRFGPSAAVAPFEVNGVKSGYVTLEFRRRPAARGVKFAIEASADLQSWSSADSRLTLVGTRENRDGTVTDTYRANRAVHNSVSETMFFRLRVLLQ